MADFLDKAKDLARDLTGKARSTVAEHHEQIDDAVDKTAEFVDDKTKRKYTEKIDKVQARAHEVVGKIADDKGRAPGDEAPGPEGTGPEGTGPEGTGPEGRGEEGTGPEGRGEATGEEDTGKGTGPGPSDA
jgi:hypothetical protein